LTRRYLVWHAGPVFIRRTATRRKRSGGSYHTFRLVRSFRTPDGVRQETLLNLGADFRVPRKQWPDLVAIVEDLAHRTDSLFDPDPELHRIARRIHARIADRVSAEPAGDLATVHLDSLDHERLRSVGGERIALRALRELGFAATLRRLGLSARQAGLACALVLARMLRPGSERAACTWLNQRSATLELLGLERDTKLELNNPCRTADRLRKHRRELEKSLAQRAAALFGGVGKVLFVDRPTCTSTARRAGTASTGARSRSATTARWSPWG